MMTDNEIKKALECCSEEDKCKQCPYYNDGNFKCLHYKFFKDLLKLINRQQEQIKIGDKIYEDTCNEFDNDLKIVSEKLKTAQAENEKLNEELKNLRTDLISLQAENESLKNAYKQCAWERDTFQEELKTASAENERLTHITRNLIGEIKAEAMTEFADKLKENSIATFNWQGFVLVEEIDNLLKEMVGEDNG